MRRRTLLGYMASGMLVGTLSPRMAVAADGLTPSGPIRVTASGTVLEGLDIAAENTAIKLRGLRDVTIRNCRIRHNLGDVTGIAHGIDATDVRGLRIENCEIINAGAPLRGPLRSDDQCNIRVAVGRDVTIDAVTVRRGSTGIYLTEVRDSRIAALESHDMRGPFPRGMALQYADCSGTHTATDLSDESIPGTSHNEDSFSVYDSPNVTLSRVVVPMMSDAKSGRGLVIEQFGSVDCVLDQAEFGWLFNGSIGLHGRRLSAVGTRTRGWNRYSVRGFAGSTQENQHPPAMLAFFSQIPSLRVEHEYWATASSNLIHNPDGNTGIRNLAVDWKPELRVVRNAFSWRPANLVPEFTLPARVGSYWLPNPNTGADGLYGNQLVPGAILAVLPGTYLHDPTSLAWQWYRNGAPIPGETGMNYLVTEADLGATLNVVESPANAAGAGSPTISDTVQL
jgi:hypothetical protein